MIPRSGGISPTTCFASLDWVCSHYFGGYDLSGTHSSHSYSVACSFGCVSSAVLRVFGPCAPGLVPRMYRRRKEVRRGHHFPRLRVRVKDTAQFMPAGISTVRVSHTYR